MTPFIETVLLIVLALGVLLAVCWIFDVFKDEKPVTDELDSIENLIYEKEGPKSMDDRVLNFAPEIPSKTVNGRTYSYKVTDEWILYKNGEYYQLIESNQGSKFFIMEGKRKYLSSLSIKDFTVTKLFRETPVEPVK